MKSEASATTEAASACARRRISVVTRPVLDDFDLAAAAVTRAIKAINNDERLGDGGEFITRLLARVAANLGSSDAVTAGRPGSWEAEGVRDLLASTVGHDDEFLMDYRTDPFEIVANTDAELADLGLFMTDEDSAHHIGRCLFGDRYTRGRDNLTYDEFVQLEAIEDQLDELRSRDYAEYQQRFAATIQVEFERRHAADPARLRCPAQRAPVRRGEAEHEQPAWPLVDSPLMARVPEASAPTVLRVPSL